MSSKKETNNKSGGTVDSMASYNNLLPNPALPLTDQPPVVLLAMCLLGEARGESPEGRRAVAQVVINRARHPHSVFGSQHGMTLHENLIRVILKPFQFSCFLTSDPNCAKLFHPMDHENSSVWSDCLAIATEFISAKHQPDTLTYNSDHYFDDSIQPPAWADPAMETVAVGRLRFFRLYLPSLGAGSGSDSRVSDGLATGVRPSPPPNPFTGGHFGRRWSLPHEPSGSPSPK